MSQIEGFFVEMNLTKENGCFPAPITQTKTKFNFTWKQIQLYINQTKKI